MKLFQEGPIADIAHADSHVANVASQKEAPKRWNARALHKLAMTAKTDSAELP